MAKTDFKSVDDYLATIPEPTRAVLEQVRATIRKALPKADEVISYQIPAYKVDGVAVVYFAGWKEHFSIYPVGEGLAEKIPEAAGFPVSKGTIKFSLKEKVPTALIVKIIKLRAKAAAEEAAARKSRTK